MTSRTIVARWGIAAVLCCLAILGARAAEDSFRLGPEDKVRLKVFEYRATQDVIYEWKAMNDEFIVGADGSLSVPFAGRVMAEGRTQDEVGKAISEQLKQRMGLVVAPDVSVSIMAYRPFFVSGDVNRPGPYPFKPGLRVIEAIATAGGSTRPSDVGLVRLGREVIEGKGDLTEAMRETDALLMRRARLQAEVAQSDVPPLPPELALRSADPAVSRIVENEMQVFKARRNALRTQSAALENLKTFLGKEVESLQAQLGTVDRQMQLVNKELTGVSSLVEKGMAIAPRQLALERTVAQIQGDKLNMQTSMLRAQAEIGRTELALIELRNSRQVEASIELRDTQAKLDELANRIDTRGKLLFESQVSAPKLLAGRLQAATVQPTFSILRNVDGRVDELPASEISEVQPGDTVKVILPFPGATPLDGEVAVSQSSTAKDGR